MDLPAGHTIAGRYELVAPLARGGSGATYKAVDTRHTRLVALKLMYADATESGAQFRREASVSRAIQHPNVLTIVDSGLENGSFYLISEFIEGGSLSDLLHRTAPLPPDRALRVAADVAAGLGAIHAAGMVHRDLKPSNILIRADGTAVVADLGLVLARGSHSLTMTGMVLGSPHYMSPEQVRGDVVDARADLFAFGVVAYEMLTGRRPFEADSATGLLHRIIAGDPTPPAQWNPAIAGPMSDVLLRSLASDPTQRFATAAEFVAAMRAAIADGLPSHAESRPARTAPAIRSGSDAPVIDESTRRFLPQRSESPRPLPLRDATGWLIMTNGPRAGERIPIRDELTIGRAAEADVFIDAVQISRRHAHVLVRDGRCILRDLGSRNGVLVNGHRVAETPLEEGDQIELGGVTLIFVADAAHPVAEAPDARLERFAECWNDLSIAVTMSDDGGFADAARRLVAGPLREALGYRIDTEIPGFHGVVGWVVSNSMLWIRHSRFPILFVAYSHPHAVLSDLVRQVELARVGAYFALVVIVPTPTTEGQAASVLQDLKDSVYRLDFVVLTRTDLEGLVRKGTARGLVQLILDQGIELSGLSPYVIRGPVPEAMFFGREREIKLITQSAQAYAVVGGRRIGKTSILMKLRRQLGFDPVWEPLYLNCEDKFDLPGFLAGMTDALETEEITELRGLRIALKNHQRASGKRLVCLLDEVDELIAQDVGSDRSSHLLMTFRALAFEDLCRFIFSGSRTLNRLGHDPRSPLFNFCDWMTVGMLDSRSVAEIVTKPLEQLGFQLNDPTALVARMMRATGGHPNLVQWLSDRLVTTTSGRRITVAHLDEAAATPAYHDHLIETTWGDASPIERLATLAIATTEFSRADYEEAMASYGITDTRAVNDALSTLRLFAVIEGSAGRYRFLNEEFVTILRASRDIDREIDGLRREMEA